MKTLLDKETISRTLDRIAHEILEHYKNPSEFALVGIRTRGEFLAKRLQERIEQFSKQKVLLGILDITLYRDDLTQIANQPMLKATEIDFDITGKAIILVDDVLYTGRTVRSALNALIDFGRPTKIELAVIIDRGHRELPIKADYIGKNIPTSKEEKIEVRLKECDTKEEVVLTEK
ncbi:MAG: bifunctional pyr operon transcriptional regulator/uracil phosphoribosyltransferase PyrR [Elusimicrobiaceae bacterium]|jgi:pyrimidine operon attenuation protein / uracil phosphoribosyltransferase|nr:bifunctional pyr operon transcriptional regulator/uracil phosphoribosyltransferase PyrR [Elusimicrobiaceae bacterium]MBT3955462.1 bifunctional pyr operon transcriptional regulator/uracil phosphoribosyltransferase PyrR [Elusimicrobiaceae bacterium]MBT4008214.1 bifunctional pyr operon transcriptional regulator/uracil phosphoribosyltransferase PyrR [Elusimicrobiaceae bacterium]MBT4403080.1 bifunctional pyr operon transcriptional regulator/uracil phosphoribosyltransferase PyrR [Elusimicrobiaceae 